MLRIQIGQGYSWVEGVKLAKSVARLVPRSKTLKATITSFMSMRKE